MTGYELFEKLNQMNLIDLNKKAYWWEDVGTFKTLVEVFLTQQSKWQKVQKSIKQLEDFNLLNPENIIATKQYKIASAIVPSGFYNQKATRIKLFVKNMIEDFKSFDNFKENVSREWLLEQKGIGFESADSILCYVCLRPTMVVDSYTNRLFKALGFEFEEYNELKEYLQDDIFAHKREILEKYKEYKDIHHVFCIFHGQIVEFCKQSCKDIEKRLKLIYA